MFERHDRRERGHFDAWIGSLSAQRELGRGLTTTATLGQAFRAPNLEDLANNSNFAGGTEFANPDLDPERSLTAQLPFDLARDTWTRYLALVDVADQNQSLRSQLAELREDNLQLREALVASGRLERIAEMRDEFDVPMRPAELGGGDV